MTSAPDVPISVLRWRTPLFALLLGALVGGSVAWWFWPYDAPPPRAEPDRAADALALVDALERSQRATFTAEGRFRREVEGEQVVDDRVVVVQRPPDRLTLGFGSWDGIVGAQRVACVRSGRDGPYLRCDRLGEGRLADVDDERLDQLRGLVVGADRAYRVTRRGDGCFRLVLERALRFEAPFGRRADVCFDPSTGAEVRRWIERDDSMDVTLLDEVTSEVAVDDLRLPG